MTLWSRHQAVQVLKSDGRCIIDGVNFANVIATFLYDESLLGALKKIVFSLFYRSDISTGRNSFLSGAEYIVFYSCRSKKRPDYDYFPEKFRVLLGQRQSYFEAVEKFSINQFFTTLFYFVDSFQRVNKFRRSSLTRILTALLLSKYRTSYDFFQGIVVNCADRTLITFSDAHPLENLITQIVMLKGGVTITNQHGQYRILDESNMSPDAEAYANFISDKLLCWGEATVREFMKYGISRERCIVVGWIKRLRLYPKDINKGPSSVFGVMLNGENGKESNQLLLEWANRLADSLDCSYHVRLHPSNNVLNYVDVVNNKCLGLQKMPVKDFFSVVSFCIAHMTGGTVEALELNCPIYLMDDSRLADVFRIDGLSYENFEELLSAVRADNISPHESKIRFEVLRLLFNDDHEQDIRLLSAICK